MLNPAALIEMETPFRRKLSIIHMATATTVKRAFVESKFIASQRVVARDNQQTARLLRLTCVAIPAQVLIQRTFQK